MKRTNHYISWLLCLALLFSACEKIEPDFFEGEYNGAYFDYQNEEEFKKTLNFGEYIIGNPDTLPVILKVKLLGYLTEESRTLSIRTGEVKGYGMAEIIIPNVTFANNEYQKDVEIKVIRPEVEDSTVAVRIYLDGEGDLGSGVVGKEEYTLYVKDVHEAPSMWTHLQKYLGEWDREKHAFFATLMNDNYYYNALYSNQAEYDENMYLNGLAVNTLLAEEPTAPITISVPILEATEHVVYNKPYFWDKYEEYIGLFSSKKFCRITRDDCNAVNTKEIISAYENSIEILKENKMSYNKEDVLTMLDEYYTYPQLGYTIDKYTEKMWVQIYFSNTYVNDSYNYLRKPYWWEDPDQLGTAEIVTEYFGEYSNKKYQIMLKAMINAEGEENFNAASILPFKIEGDKWNWDETVNGRARLIECYKTIKAYNEGLSSKNRVEIPEVSEDKLQ